MPFKQQTNIDTGADKNGAKYDDIKKDEMQEIPSENGILNVQSLANDSSTEVTERKVPESCNDPAVFSVLTFANSIYSAQRMQSMEMMIYSVPTCSVLAIHEIFWAKLKQDRVDCVDGMSMQNRRDLNRFYDNSVKQIMYLYSTANEPTCCSVRYGKAFKMCGLQRLDDVVFDVLMKTMNAIEVTGMEGKVIKRCAKCAQHIL